MERDEKRMAGGYEITHAIHIGNTEIVMGENPKAPEDERYMVADYKEKGILAQYVNCCASDDFIELAEVFAERLTEQIRQIKKQRDKTLCGKKPIDRNEGAHTLSEIPHRAAFIPKVMPPIISLVLVMLPRHIRTWRVLVKTHHNALFADTLGLKYHISLILFHCNLQ